MLLGAAYSIKIKGDPTENQLMAALEGAINDEAGAESKDEVVDAIEAADKAGELPSAEQPSEEKKESE